ncbi:hypothetical protein I6H08_36495 (plasmid) [Burkholderia gladioli]|nr:hypothetical protein I6H08_36495 [Burkholderia gladioli]
MGNDFRQGARAEESQRLLGGDDVGLRQYKRIYIAGEEGEIAGKKAIMGALALYLDFLNLFLMLMRLFGSRRS